MAARIRSVISLLLFATCVWGQDFRATLTGIVTDPSGAAIPQAAVKVVNVQTNTAKEVETTSIGNYTVPYLDPGTYRVEVSAKGFQKLIRENVMLRVADKVNLPVLLTVGASSESITVTTELGTIETGSADRGLVFDPVKTQQ